MSLYLVFSLIVISSVDILWDHLVFSVVGTHEHLLVLYEHVLFSLYAALLLHIFVV